MSQSKIVIMLALTIEDPTMNVEGSIDFIKTKIEEASKGPLAEACWSMGNFVDAEVKDIHLIKSYGF